MSTNLYDLANELERVIRHLPEYQAVVTAKEAVYADSEAKTIFEHYVAYQKEIQDRLQTGQLLDENVQVKMEEFSQQIKANSLLADYFQKQQHLSVYITDLEKIIFKPLQELL